MAIALLLIAVPTIPHHHHYNKQEICLLDDVDALNCCLNHGTPNSDCNHNSCTTDCITNFNGITPQQSDNFKISLPVVQLFTIQFSEYIAQFLSPIKTLAQYPVIYIETLHEIAFFTNHGLRAPPSLLF